MRKRPRSAVLASAFLLGTAITTLAQNLNDDHLLDIAQAGIAKLAVSEWNELPQSELDCATTILRERGDSVESFAERGWVAPMRCAEAMSSGSAHAGDRS
jgi:hypothetical protein